MRVNIKTKDIEMTDAIRQYIDERLVAVEKLVEGYDPEALINVEIGKTTEHHNKGPFLRCEMNLTFLGNMFRAEEQREDLYEAIDLCKDELRRQVADHKDKVREEQRVPRPDKE